MAAAQLAPHAVTVELDDDHGTATTPEHRFAYAERSTGGVTANSPRSPASAVDGQKLGDAGQFQDTHLVRLHAPKHRRDATSVMCALDGLDEDVDAA
jgi:hypothetical protein